MTKKPLGVVVPVFHDLRRCEHDELGFHAMLLHDLRNHHSERLTHNGFATAWINRQHRDIREVASLRFCTPCNIEKTHTLVSHNLSAGIEVWNLNALHQVR